MKTIINGDGSQILRVSDAIAEVKVESGVFKYAPKSEYKTKVRDVRKAELAEIAEAKKAEKKSKGKKSKKGE